MLASVQETDYEGDGGKVYQVTAKVAEGKDLVFYMDTVGNDEGDKKRAIALAFALKCVHGVKMVEYHRINPAEVKV